MKLATDSHKRLEEFFREYLMDETFVLPKIYFYGGSFTRFFTYFVKVHGITFGRRIFILPALISINNSDEPRLSEQLAAHEITHVIQYQKHGFIGFFYNYLKCYINNLRCKKRWDLNSRQAAYFEIPFEIQARDAAMKFAEWNGEKRRLDSAEKILKENESADKT
jgi:hypothetical protein